MKRRTFLQTLAATAATAPIFLDGMPVRANSSLPFLAQMRESSSDKILIFIQLFGGNDGLNTVIPVDDPMYYTLRPNIGIVKANTYNVLGTNNIYLNMGLAAGSQRGMAGMLENGWLAVVRGIGYTPANLSHFRSTDIWLSGINDSNPNDRLATGWVGRMLSKQYPSFPQSLPPDPLAIQLGGFSLTLLSDKGRMGIEVADPSKQVGVSSELDQLDSQATATHYADEYAFVADIANRSNTYAKNVRDAYANGKAKLKASYGSDSFGQQMGSVAAMIAGGLKTKAYVVSLGGFDTHVSQQSLDGLSGQQPSLLARLGDGCAQFMHDMIALGLADNIIGMTVSEFGRRPAENGSYGTDHGAASVAFVFGTQVNSAVFGAAPDLTNLDENGDIAFQIDYRRVYLDILTKWFGMTLADARVVLNDTNGVINPLGTIKSQSGVDGWKADQPSGVAVTNYPNPFTSSTTFELNLTSTADVVMDISNVAGERIARLVERRLEAGVHKIQFDPRSVSGRALPSGVYLCSVMAGTQRITRMIECVR